MMTFILAVQFGNDAMQSSKDLADALQSVVNRIRENEYVETSKASKLDIRRGINDANGNYVGGWELLRKGNG